MKKNLLEWTNIDDNEDEYSEERWRQKSEDTDGCYLFIQVANIYLDTVGVIGQKGACVG